MKNLFYFQRKAAEDFNDAHRKVQKRLAKESISESEFATYVNEQEQLLIKSTQP